ncbi:GDP-D-glucose phosphorylase 1-like [Daphnia pulex]|uniref:GDP-D-glucose phosphorylase 1-like n=1 Tax=Daphnia pulex TaxID=6669 RepID=UPI001EDF8622|nr:GDP-D-glucose phosphorylase 1-like [Daphnia pulex]
MGSFIIRESRLVTSAPSSSAIIRQQHSEFDRVLKSRWKEAADSAVCFYRLDRLQNKVIAGKYGFVAQYNPEKSKPGWRRPAQNFQKVNPNFDVKQFNFNQVTEREVVMGPEELPAVDKDDSDTFLLINISPIEFGSCLLVPRMTQNIPQLITLHGLQVLLTTVLLSTDPRLKAGFSSAGGCASVNHQHYHVYYLEEQLYLETAPVERIAGPCFAVTDYPAKGFAFQLDNNDPAQLARHVFTLADYMRQNQMAHNMFITRGRSFDVQRPGLSADADAHYGMIYETLRVFLWAREPAFGVKKDYGSMNPALCEMGGHLLTTDKFEFEAMTEEAVSNILQDMTSPWFQRVLPKIPLLFHDTFQDSS